MNQCFGKEGGDACGSAIFELTGVGNYRRQSDVKLVVKKKRNIEGGFFSRVSTEKSQEEGGILLCEQIRQTYGK